MSGRCNLGKLRGWLCGWWVEKKWVTFLFQFETFLWHQASALPAQGVNGGSQGIEWSTGIFEDKGKSGSVPCLLHIGHLGLGSSGSFLPGTARENGLEDCSVDAGLLHEHVVGGHRD